jgi:hypothetical protein
MQHETGKTPSRDAVARRRRMKRRHAKRRLTKVISASAIVLTMGMVMRPDAPGNAVGTRSALATDSSTKDQSASILAAQPIWRPAGEVLKRGKTSSTHPLDLGNDERHESLNRWHSIYSFSTRYRIKPDLARRIYDAAITAGIEPELGFRVVRVESVFDPRAVSRAGALGLTQLMPGTARDIEPNVTREQLLDPDINLRIGFKYLRGLIREYKGDLKLALLVYNRGPVAVNAAIAMGQSPANGYESLITKGYRGRGTLD